MLCTTNDTMAEYQHRTFKAHSVDSFLKVVLNDLEPGFVCRGQTSEFGENGQE